MKIEKQQNPFYNCEHGKTVFDDCDQCEIIWLQARIDEYEAKLALRRSQLAKLRGKQQVQYA